MRKGWIHYLTCDNGIAAVDQIGYAKDHGMTVIVTDHHEPQDRIPPADVIVNPKQEGCPYPFKNLCGAAVAWKVVQCLYELFDIGSGKHPWSFWSRLAIATVGDVMDLTEENRILVKEGLKKLNHTTDPGLHALIQANGLEQAQLNAYHIGFVSRPLHQCQRKTGHGQTGVVSFAGRKCGKSSCSGPGAEGVKR